MGNKAYIVLSNSKAQQGSIIHSVYDKGCDVFADRGYKELSENIFNEELLYMLEKYDSIIVWSNESKSKSIMYIDNISRRINIDKWIFMFGSEM